MKNVNDKQKKKKKTDSRNEFFFRMKRTGTKNQLKNVNKFDDLLREISFHSFLNQTKAIIYKQNYEFITDFVESLKYQYSCVKDAVEDSFSKPRNTNTVDAAK